MLGWVASIVVLLTSCLISYHLHYVNTIPGIDGFCAWRGMCLYEALPPKSFLEFQAKQRAQTCLSWRTAGQETSMTLPLNTGHPKKSWQSGCFFQNLSPRTCTQLKFHAYLLDPTWWNQIQKVSSMKLEVYCKHGMVSVQQSCKWISERVEYPSKWLICRQISCLKSRKTKWLWTTRLDGWRCSTLKCQRENVSILGRIG